MRKLITCGFAIFFSVCLGFLAVSCKPGEETEPPGQENHWVFVIGAEADSVKKDERLELSVQTLTLNGEGVSEQIAWHTTDDSIASVEDGILTGLSAGSVEVYAEIQGGAVVSNRLTVNVYEAYEQIRVSDTDLINYYGRNGIEESSVTLYNTASAFEVSFMGESLTAELYSEKADARMQLYVNGKPVAAQLTLDVGSKSYNLAENCDADERTTVRAIKVNSADKSTIRLTALETDGVFVTPSAKPQLKLEFYGDSITCGLGVNGLQGDTPANEDGTVTYAYLAAQQLGAQAFMQCYSGISAAVPVTQWGWREDEYMGTLYDWYAPRVEDAKWDFTSYEADVIVVNLGTNDNSAIRQGNGSYDLFVSRYIAFVQALRAQNPDAPILLCYGMMGSDSSLSACVRRVQQEAGVSGVEYLNMRKVSCTGFNGHPDAAGHMAGAEELIAKIRTLIADTTN